jgi:hypothetical protein
MFLRFSHLGWPMPALLAEYVKDSDSVRRVLRSAMQAGARALPGWGTGPDVDRPRA